MVLVPQIPLRRSAMKDEGPSDSCIHSHISNAIHRSWSLGLRAPDAAAPQRAQGRVPDAGRAWRQGA